MINMRLLSTTARPVMSVLRGLCTSSEKAKAWSKALPSTEANNEGMSSRDEDQKQQLKQRRQQRHKQEMPEVKNQKQESPDNQPRAWSKTQVNAVPSEKKKIFESGTWSRKPLSEVSDKEMVKNRIMSGIKASILLHYNSNPSETFTAYFKARDKNLELTTEHYEAVLSACLKLPFDSRSDVSMEIFEKLKLENKLSLSTFMKLSKIHAQRGHYVFVQRILQQYLEFSKSEEPPYELLVPMVIACARGNPANEELMRTYYTKLLSGVEENKCTVDPYVFWTVAYGYMKADNDRDCIEILRTMIDVGITPTPSDARSLFESSLFVGSNRVLRVLANWYLNNFSESLDRGVITQILHVASARGDTELANMSMQLLEKFGYEKSLTHYLCLINASIMAEDLASAFEGLVQAQKDGMDIYADPVAGFSLTKNLSRKLTSMKSLDEMYFAATDLIKVQLSPPPVILDAIIMGSGKRGNIDRAFATFQEMKTVLNVPPTIHTYNALLFATSRSKVPKLVNMLSVLQDMEDVRISADATTFSILLELIPETNEYQGLDDILAHLSSCGIRPTSRSLRRIIKFLVTAKEFAKAEDLVHLYFQPLKFTEGEARPPLPVYFRKWLESEQARHLEESKRTAITDANPVSAPEQQLAVK